MSCEENNIEHSNQKLVDKNSMIETKSLYRPREDQRHREHITSEHHGFVIDSFTKK